MERKTTLAQQGPGLCQVPNCLTPNNPKSQS